MIDCLGYKEEHPRWPTLHQVLLQREKGGEGVLQLPQGQGPESKGRIQKVAPGLLWIFLNGKWCISIVNKLNNLPFVDQVLREIHYILGADSL